MIFLKNAIHLVLPLLRQRLLDPPDLVLARLANQPQVIVRDPQLEEMRQRDHGPGPPLGQEVVVELGHPDGEADEAAADGVQRLLVGDGLLDGADVAEHAVVDAEGDLVVQLVVADDAVAAPVVVEHPRQVGAPLRREHLVRVHARHAADEARDLVVAPEPEVAPRHGEDRARALAHAEPLEGRLPRPHGQRLHEGERVLQDRQRREAHVVGVVAAQASDGAALLTERHGEVLLLQEAQLVALPGVVGLGPHVEGTRRQHRVEDGVVPEGEVGDLPAPEEGARGEHVDGPVVQLLLLEGHGGDGLPAVVLLRLGAEELLRLVEHKVVHQAELPDAPLLGLGDVEDLGVR